MIKIKVFIQKGKYISERYIRELKTCFDIVSLVAVLARIDIMILQRGKTSRQGSSKIAEALVDRTPFFTFEHCKLFPRTSCTAHAQWLENDMSPLNHLQKSFACEKV